jgi:gas vesicle protein GvpK/gas vesicle protein GvpA/GvpJ/GvpM family
MPAVLSRRDGVRPRPALMAPQTLADALDRILCRGVSVEGNLTVGVAGIELLYLDLRLLLASIDTVWPGGRPPAAPSRLAPPAPASPPPVLCPPGRAADRTADGAGGDAAPGVSGGSPAPRPSPADGLVRLVLTLVKLLHELLERQAVRRMAAGRLSDAEIEAVGAALLAQADEIERLRRHFGFAAADLALRPPDGCH